MIGGRDDVVIVRGGARRVAAEEDIGAVMLEGVVKSVEDFRRHQVARHEHIGTLECLRLHHHRRLPTLSLSLSLTQSLLNNRYLTDSLRESECLDRNGNWIFPQREIGKLGFWIEMESERIGNGNKGKANFKNAGTGVFALVNWFWCCSCPSFFSWTFTSVCC